MTREQAVEKVATVLRANRILAETFKPTPPTDFDKLAESIVNALGISRRDPLVCWTYELLIPTARDGTTIGAVDENGRTITIKFEREEDAANLWGVIATIKDHQPEAVGMELRVTQDRSEPQP